MSLCVEKRVVEQADESSGQATGNTANDDALHAFRTIITMLSLNRSHHWQSELMRDPRGEMWLLDDVSHSLTSCEFHYNFELVAKRVNSSTVVFLLQLELSPNSSRSDWTRNSHPSY